MLFTFLVPSIIKSRSCFEIVYSCISNITTNGNTKINFELQQGLETNLLLRSELTFKTPQKDTINSSPADCSTEEVGTVNQRNCTKKRRKYRLSANFDQLEVIKDDLVHKLIRHVQTSTPCYQYEECS